jgi:hypothetical protein
LGRGFRDLLTFHAGDHVVPVVVQDGGCGAVQVHAGGPGAPALEDGSRVDHLVLRALGLPAGYCWSR